MLRHLDQFREDEPTLAFVAELNGRRIDLWHASTDRFRMLLNEVELLTPDQPLPKLPVARAFWRPEPDLTTSAEAWLSAGGPHHTVLTDQLGTEVDLVVYGEFDDEAALAAYKAHPDYQRSIDLVRPIREMRMAADYESDAAAKQPLQ